MLELYSSQISHSLAQGRRCWRSISHFWKGWFNVVARKTMSI
jgi:hypothetical protein